MRPVNEKLRADLLEAGKREFMENGFRGASLKSIDRKSTRLNSSHLARSRMPSSA